MKELEERLRDLTTDWQFEVENVSNMHHNKGIITYSEKVNKLADLWEAYKNKVADAVIDYTKHN